MTNCLISTGNELNCGEFTLQGGVSKIYIANAEQLTSFTDVSLDGIFDTITMVGANVFYEFAFYKDGSMATQTLELSEGRSALKQTVMLTIPNYDQAKATLAGQLTHSKIVVIFELKNGKKFVYGYGLDGTKTPLEAEATEMTSGRAMADNLGTTYTFSCYASTYAPEFIGTIPV